MIPSQVETYLKEHHVEFEPRRHFRAVPAQELAAAEHVSGARVAKPVVVMIDGELAMAVVSAAQRVELDALRRATGASDVRLAPEGMFAERFAPCEPGAEPPIGLFGLSLYVDAELAQEPRLLMRAGTHEDAVLVETRGWMESEKARTIPGLGVPLH